MKEVLVPIVALIAGLILGVVIPEIVSLTLAFLGIVYLGLKKSGIL